MIKRTPNSFAPNRESGFSLIEMMFAIGLMMMVITAAFTLMSGSLRASMSGALLTDAQQNLRTAQKFINDDLVNSGDGLQTTGAIYLNATFVQNYLAVTAVGATNDFVNLGVITSDTNVQSPKTVNSTTPATPVVGVLDDSDRITILTTPADRDAGFPVDLLAFGGVNSTATSLFIPTAKSALFEVGGIYMLTSNGNAGFVMVTKKVTLGSYVVLECKPSEIGVEDYDINKASSATPAKTPIELIKVNHTQAASLTRMLMSHYFVDTNGLLRRRVFGTRGASFRDSVIAENIKEFKFRYGLQSYAATTGAATTLEFRDALDTAARISAARQVEIKITTKTAKNVNPGAAVAKYPEATATTRVALRSMATRNSLNNW